MVEERLGVRIFARGHQGAELTALGRVVAEGETLLNKAKIFDHNIELHRRGEPATNPTEFPATLYPMILP